MRPGPFFPPCAARVQIARVVGLHYNTVARRLKECETAASAPASNPHGISPPEGAGAASASEGADAASASSAAAGALAVVAAAAAAEEDRTRRVRRPRRARHEIEDDSGQRSGKAKRSRS